MPAHLLSTDQRRPFAVGVADFNRDDRKDLLVIYDEENQLEMLLGQMDGSFLNDAIYASGLSSSPSSFALADVNNDSRTDVLVTYTTDTNAIVAFLGLHRASFHTESIVHIDE